MKCCICGKEIEKKYSLEGKLIWSDGNNEVLRAKIEDYFEDRIVILGE